MTADFAQAVKGADDDTLREFIGMAESELKLRDDRRKADARKRAEAILAKATEEARAVLQHVGLPMDTGKGRRPKRTKSAYRAGQIYRHPENSALTWNGKGVRPGWIRDLESAGRRPDVV